MSRRPPRSIAPVAAPVEAAAIIAALERFMRDTAPPPALAPPLPGAHSAWARAALLEATGHARVDTPPASWSYFWS